MLDRRGFLSNVIAAGALACGVAPMPPRPPKLWPETWDVLYDDEKGTQYVESLRLVRRPDGTVSYVRSPKNG